MDSDQKSKKDAITLAIENNPCGLCRLAGYPNCRGHGGGGGSDSGGGEAKSEAKDVRDLFYKIAKADDGSIKITDQEGKSINISSELTRKILTPNFQKIFEPLLSIKSDIEQRILTIQIKPGISKDQKEEMQEFLNIVKNDCHDFMKAKGFLPEDYTAIIDKDNNLLKIHIPDKKLYNEFVDRLSKNSLLLLEKAKQQKREKQEYINPPQEKKENIKKPYQNPFSTRLERK